VIQSITLEDVQQAARSFIDPKAFSRFYMYPTEKA
jgi:predicted Zn-dependent peptidase